MAVHACKSSMRILCILGVGSLSALVSLVDGAACTYIHSVTFLDGLRLSIDLHCFRTVGSRPAEQMAAWHLRLARTPLLDCSMVYECFIWLTPSE